MASLTLTIADEKVDFVARSLGWTPESGVTRGAWIKTYLINHVRERGRSYDLKLSVQAVATTDTGVT